MEGNGFSSPASRRTGGISRREAVGGLAGGTALTLALALSLAGNAAAQAQATPGKEVDGDAPNHFELTGAETRLICDLTPRSGGPGGLTLIYEGPYGSQTFAGDALRTEQSALGLLMTGYLGAFPDQGELWLTLLLPTFNAMTAEDAPSPFATLAILKWRISTIAGPPRTGALEEYRVLPLEGVAERIVS